MDFHKLLIRSISGAVYCAIIVCCILCGYWGVFALGVLLSALACVEMSKMFHELSREELPVLIIDITGCICLAIAPIMPVAMLMWIAAMVVRLIEQLYIVEGNPVKEMALSAFKQLYIGLPMLLMTAIAYLIHPMLILAIFIFIWINDTGAFLVGSMFGKHRLFERISPKKSWEGFFGGLIFNLGFSVLFYYCFNDFFGLGGFGTLGIWLGLAATVSVFGTWGDLVESLMKRSLHIKDSGNLIPGHGGILDRIDSLLLVLPAVTLYLAIVICL